MSDRRNSVGWGLMPPVIELLCYFTCHVERIHSKYKPVQVRPFCHN